MLRRIRKPFAMTFAALLLSLGLVTSSSNQAQALSTATVLPQLAGHAKLVMPSLLATAIRLHPVGFGISAVAALGMGLYSSRDYWLPYVTGQWGAGDSNVKHDTSQANNLQWAEPGLVVGSASETNGVVSGSWSFTPQNIATRSGDWTAIYSYLGKCERNADKYVAYRVADVTQGITTGRSKAWTFTHSIQLCPTGWTVKGYMVGGGGGADASGQFSPRIYGDGSAHPEKTAQFGGNTEPLSGTHGTTNIMKFGDFTPSGFDPRGEGSKYITQTECMRLDGSTFNLEAVSAGPDGGIKMASCAAVSPGAHGTGKTLVIGQAPDGTRTTLWETTAIEDTENPLCSPSRAGSGCELKVAIDGKECVVGSVECENWTEIYRDSAARVSCQYGPYTVGVDKCNVLERAYLTGGAPATEANTDGNPATKSFTEPGGQTYTPTQPGTTTGTVPGTGTTPGPASAPAMGTPEYDCWPNGWKDFNPEGWILKPIRCAFEPKIDIQTAVTALQTKADTKVPLSYLNNDLIGPASGTCPNWNVVIPGQFTESAVCESSFTDALRGIRTPLFALVATAMMWPFVRSVWYSSIPVLRVSPSSGK